MAVNFSNVAARRASLTGEAAGSGCRRGDHSTPPPGSGRVFLDDTTHQSASLVYLDDGQTVRGAAKAVGGYHREVKRVADRYNSAGLEAALSDDPEH
jgi:hypothetical protein